MPAPHVAVVGAGPGGLMAAEILARAGVTVTVFDRMPSPGRKFLLAGRGGLNLTHSEPLDALLDRYGAARPALETAIRAFPPAALRDWCASLGQTTFVGSSGRVFPQTFRATPLLRAWLRMLGELGVEFRMRHRWTGWTDDGSLRFVDAEDRSVTVRADATVLALGGASWPRTGSDGAWVSPVRAAGVGVAPMRPANGGFDMAWSPAFAERYAGTPLKNVTVQRAGSDSPPVRGEAMITATGIEGGAIYAISADLRDAFDAFDALDNDGTVELSVDLHPDLTIAELTVKLAKYRARDSFASHLRRNAGLAPVAIALLGERVDAGRLTVDDAAGLSRLIKGLRLRVVAPRPIERAISSAGGIVLDEVDETSMLRHQPGVFVAGEMLDWEAPTGGYLLQATFSTAVLAANGVLHRLGVPVGSASAPLDRPPPA